MNNENYLPKSFLQSGNDLFLTPKVKVKHPTIKEIKALDTKFNGLYSETIYYSYLSVFLCDPYNYMVYLDDKKIDYQTVDEFDLFIMLYNDEMEKYREAKRSGLLSDEEIEKRIAENKFYGAFKFFLGIDGYIIGKDKDGNYAIGDINTNEVLIDKTIFSGISNFIRKINDINYTDKIDPEDEFAKSILIEDERSRLKKMSRRNENEPVDILGGMLSIATWNGSGITPFNRDELHIYDLVDCANRIDKILTYDHVMTGIYSGCLDKTKIDLEQISWRR